MERLTKKYGVVYPRSEIKNGELYLQLAAYEDTELSPAEITKLREHNKELEEIISRTYINGSKQVNDMDNEITALRTENKRLEKALDISCNYELGTKNICLQQAAAEADKKGE